MKLITFVIFFMSLIGCVSLDSLSVSSIPEERNKVVEAESKRIVFLGFNFDNDYVDSVYDKLRQKCSDGKVTGILTTHETTAYLIVFKRVAKAQGYCVRTKSSVQLDTRGNSLALHLHPQPRTEEQSPSLNEALRQ